MCYWFDYGDFMNDLPEGERLTWCETILFFAVIFICSAVLGLFVIGPFVYWAAKLIAG